MVREVAPRRADAGDLSVGLIAERLQLVEDERPFARVASACWTGRTGG
jgi:hypothetical protein